MEFCAENLAKSLGSRAIVHDLTVQVNPGEAVGLLGVNGAGKSTSLRMLAGLLPPDRGRVRVGEHDLYRSPKHAKPQLGFAAELPNFPAEHTVGQLLRFCAAIRGCASPARAAAEAMERCGLADASDRWIKHLSKGYLQRVSIAQALVHQPMFLFLDEPTAGLDPRQLVEIRQLIRDLKSHHGLIISSHVLTEIEQLCDRALILHHGQVVFDETLSKPSDDVTTLRVRTGNDGLALTTLSARYPELAIEQSEQGFTVTGRNLAATTPDIATTLVGAGFALQELSPVASSLEQIFMQLIKAEPV